MFSEKLNTLAPSQTTFNRLSETITSIRPSKFLSKTIEAIGKLNPSAGCALALHLLGRGNKFQNCCTFRLKLYIKLNIRSHSRKSFVFYYFIACSHPYPQDEAHITEPSPKCAPSIQSGDPTGARKDFLDSFPMKGDSPESRGPMPSGAFHSSAPPHSDGQSTLSWRFLADGSVQQKLYPEKVGKKYISVKCANPWEVAAQLYSILGATAARRHAARRDEETVPATGRMMANVGRQEVKLGYGVKRNYGSIAFKKCFEFAWFLQNIENILKMFNLKSVLVIFKCDLDYLLSTSPINP